MNRVISPSLGSSPLIFLDFDGVVCDSESECYVSSWLTFQNITRDSKNPGHSVDHIELLSRERFRQMRPLIRSGEDYVVIQDILARKEIEKEFKLPLTQDDFDVYRNSLGKKLVSTYKSAMLETRNKFISNNRSDWLSLNYLYPHMYHLLTTRDLSNVRILSTKDTGLVIEILHANHIFIPAGCIFHADSNPAEIDTRKLDMISQYLDLSTASRALFVEDQIDHLIDNSDSRITTYLADWGYVLPRWLTDKERQRREKIKIITEAQVTDLFQHASVSENLET